MIVRQYAPCSLGRSIICLGKQGEINALRVEFDVSAWMAMYPDATVKLMHFAPDRPQDNPVIPTLGVEGTLRVWIVGEEDTAGAGNGVIELLLIDERTGSTIKSATGYTTVLRSPSAGIEAQEAEAGYVRYDVDQSALLTDEQKAVARKNIGAGTGDGTGSGGILKETDPTVPDWAKQPSKPTYTAGEVGALPSSYTPPVTSVNGKTGEVALSAQDVRARPDTWTPSASDVGADAAGTASGAVAAHNTSGAAHADLRALIEGLTSRLNALADSDDTTLDQLSEIVAYIKSNKTLIDAVTTGKVSTSDIVDNLTTNASGKVLSAAQGVALKAMIDGIVIPTALPNPQPITINGQRYDGSEAVTVTVSSEGGGTPVEIDDTLTQSGKAADAKAVGDRLSALNEAIDAKGDPTDEQVSTAVNSYLDANPIPAYIDYDANVKAVAHRGYSTVAPENTIPAYILAKQKGFNYAECDVSFTSDGVAVLLHDATIDRTSDGSGSIGSMTYAEVLQYDFGSWKSSAYTGVKIASFDEFMMTCKALGIHPYIELKSNGSYTQEQITGIVDAVKAHGMQGKVTYISFNATYLGYVKTADSAARLGYLADVTSATIATANGLNTDKNEVFMDVSYDSVTDEKVALCIENGMPLEIWTVNSENVIRNMDAYVSGVTSDNVIAGKVLYNKYLTYTAPKTPDIDTSVPATGITLSASTLTFNDIDSQTLTATVEPSDTTDKVVWTTSAGDVATVSGGVVTPVGNGSATITATAGSVSASCEVTVNIAEIVTHTVTRNLTGCTSNNSATSVIDGSLYTETLTASYGYTMDGATVSVTMGGEDITETAYLDGVVSIAHVSGNVIVTATASANESIDTSLLYKWDFTKSLTDEIKGVTAKTNNATQGSSGITFSKGNTYLQLTHAKEDMAGKSVEIDFSVFSSYEPVGHCRAFVIQYGDYSEGVTYSSAAGFMWRYNNSVGWTFYNGSSWGTALNKTDYPIDFFDGKTVRLSYDATTYETTVSYADIGSEAFTELATFSNSNASRLVGYLAIGGAMQDNLCNCTITGVRVYSNT